jgi:hypothetical protein
MGVDARRRQAPVREDGNGLFVSAVQQVLAYLKLKMSVLWLLLRKQLPVRDDYDLWWSAIAA